MMLGTTNIKSSSNYFITVHQNSTLAFTEICAVAQVVSCCLSPRRPRFNPRQLLVVETVALGQL